MRHFVVLVQGSPTGRLHLHLHTCQTGSRGHTQHTHDWCGTHHTHVSRPCRPRCYIAIFIVLNLRAWCCPPPCAQGEADIRMRIRRRGSKHRRLRRVGHSSRKIQPAYAARKPAKEQRTAARSSAAARERNAPRVQEARSHCSPEGRSSCRSRRHDPASQTPTALSTKLNNLPPQEGGYAW